MWQVLSHSPTLGLALLHVPLYVAHLQNEHLMETSQILTCLHNVGIAPVFRKVPFEHSTSYATHEFSPLCFSFQHYFINNCLQIQLK